MIYKLYAEVLKVSSRATFTFAVKCVVCCMPKNLRQYYADQMMLLHVELQYGK